MWIGCSWKLLNPWDLGRECRIWSKASLSSCYQVSLNLNRREGRETCRHRRLSQDWGSGVGLALVPCRKDISCLWGSNRKLSLGCRLFLPIFTYSLHKKREILFLWSLWFKKVAKFTTELSILASAESRSHSGEKQIIGSCPNLGLQVTSGLSKLNLQCNVITVLISFLFMLK